jgi:small subunit ribosomal protein S16
MVKIRLARYGSKKKPYYRIMIADSSHPRDGRATEQIGIYNPLTAPPTVKVNQEKLSLWLGRGAQPTRTVASLLRLHSKAGSK